MNERQPAPSRPRTFSVAGMMCAACSARVERAVSAVPGVAGCAVSLLTNSMRVEGDAADAVLVHSRLSDVVAALRLGRATLRNIRENLFWAFAYNVLLIPLAAGALYPLLGWKMHPDLGALAMSLSSFCVCANALRLNRFDPAPARPRRQTSDRIPAP